LKPYIIAYDVGTTGIKTCVFEVGESIQLVASAMEVYELYVLENGGAEQEPADWWQLCAPPPAGYWRIMILTPS
jgi:xylulokinase